MHSLSKRSASSGGSTELGLIKRVAQADLRACRVLAHRLSGRVQQLVRRLLGDYDASDAIAIEALVEILHAAAVYRPDGSIEAWADRLTVRVALDRGPRRARRRLTPLGHVPVGAAPAHRLRECLAALPTVERQVLVLSELVNLDSPAIASAIHIPEGAVGGHALAARSALRELLGAPPSVDPQAKLGRRRWIECMDRSAVGEGLTPEDQEFCERHVASDPLAASERALLDELRRYDPTPNAQHRALVDAALHRFTERGERAEREEASRAKAGSGTARWGWVVLAASLVTLALGMLMLPSVPKEIRRTPAAAAPPVAPRMRLVYAAGEVHIDGELAKPESLPLSEGTSLGVGAGGACVIVDPGLAFCTGSGTLLRLTAVTGAKRRIDLETGRLALRVPLQPQGAELAVVTGGVRASSSGGTFTLDADPITGVRTVVFDGAISLGVEGAAALSIGARNAAMVRAGAVTLEAANDSDGSAINELLLPLLSWRKPLVATLDLRNVPMDAEVSIDDQWFGAAPLLAIIPAGAHRLRVRSGERTLAALDFSTEIGKVTALSFADSVEPLTPPDPTVVGKSP